MANSIRTEDKLYKILKDEKVKVHPIIWELLNHHIRNDLYVITGITEDFFDKKEPLTEEKKDKIFQRIKNIASLMKKLQEVINWDGRYYHTILSQQDKK